MEQQPSSHEQNELDELNKLYEEIYNQDLFVKEFMWNEKSYGAAVGSIADLMTNFGLKDESEITEEFMAGIPPMLMFAMPGTGYTRVDAVTNAYQEYQQLLAHENEVAAGALPGTLYGSFQLDDAKVSAYMPDSEPDIWTVIIERPNENAIRETLPMDYAPIFGPDASDINKLNQFIEELIVKYKLEDIEK